MLPWRVPCKEYKAGLRPIPCKRALKYGTKSPLIMMDHLAEDGPDRGQAGRGMEPPGSPRPEGTRKTGESGRHEAGPYIAVRDAKAATGQRRASEDAEGEPVGPGPRTGSPCSW